MTDQHPLRDQIAAIVNPAAYSETYVARKLHVWGSEAEAKAQQMRLCDQALAKADAILALAGEPSANSLSTEDVKISAESLQEGDVERVARAMVRADGLNPDTCTLGVGMAGPNGLGKSECVQRLWQTYVGKAHAAIAALTPPAGEG